MHKTVLKLDLTKSNIETIIVDIYDENIREIIGVGSYEKKGFLENELVNIDQAINSINQAYYIAKKDFIREIDEMTVLLSSQFSKKITVGASVNIEKGYVSEQKINQVLQMANYNGLKTNVETSIHTEAVSFKLDDKDEVIYNPLNIKASILYVTANIYFVGKDNISNIRYVLKDICYGGNINFVLDSFESLNENYQLYSTQKLAKIDLEQFTENVDELTKKVREFEKKSFFAKWLHNRKYFARLALRRSSGIVKK
jgi:hypothetical protein